MKTDTTDHPDGAVFLPRRASLKAAVGLGVALATYTAGVGAWTSKNDSRLEAAERAIAAFPAHVLEGDRRILDRGDERWRQATTRLDTLERDRSSADVRLTRVEEQFRWVAEALGRIESKLDARRR